MNEAERLKQRRLVRAARPIFRELARQAEQVRLRAIGKGQEAGGRRQEQVRTPCVSGGPEEEGTRQQAEGSEEKSGRDARGPSEEGLGTPLDDSTDRRFRGGEFR